MCLFFGRIFFLESSNKFDFITVQRKPNGILLIFGALARAPAVDALEIVEAVHATRAEAALSVHGGRLPDKVTQTNAFFVVAAMRAEVDERMFILFWDLVQQLKNDWPGRAELLFSQRKKVQKIL